MHSDRVGQMPANTGSASPAEVQPATDRVRSLIAGADHGRRTLLLLASGRLKLDLLKTMVRSDLLLLGFDWLSLQSDERIFDPLLAHAVRTTHIMSSVLRAALPPTVPARHRTVSGRRS